MKQMNRLLLVMCLVLITPIAFINQAAGRSPSEVAEPPSIQGPRTAGVVGSGVAPYDSDRRLASDVGRSAPGAPYPQAFQLSPPTLNSAGRIVFAFLEAEQYEIGVVNADGSGFARLTDNPGDDHTPAWSPDGVRIAYACSVGVGSELCVMNADGTGRRQLTQYAGAGRVSSPSWSPDGQRLVFTLSSPESPTAAAGSGLYLTALESGSAAKIGEGIQPVWSPDGSRIAFLWAPAGIENRQLYVSNLDGSGVQQLTRNQGDVTYLAWSPDGPRIAYSQRKVGDGVYIMNADGSDPRQVAAQYSMGLSWSPDGRELLLSLGGLLTIVNADGSRARPLRQGIHPSWTRAAAILPSDQLPPSLILPTSPVMQPPVQPTLAAPMPVSPALPATAPSAQLPPVLGRIAFASNFQGDYEIYTVNADGTNLVRLTNSPGEDWFPAWSPDGSRIAYQCRQTGNFALCVMNADGNSVSSLALMLNGAVGDAQRPTWSPDGRHIAVSVESMSAPTGIEIIDLADPARSRFLTNGRDPSWSPDGTRIVYMENFQVFVINTDGSGKQQLTNSTGYCMYPTWSPDGTRIAYSVDGQGLHVMNADGSNDRIVAPYTSWGLAWSPDGSQLALGYEGSLVILNADGSAPRAVAQGVQPSWSQVSVVPVRVGPASPQPPPAPVASPPVLPQPSPELATVVQPPAPAPTPPAAASLPGYIIFPVFKPGMSKATYDIYVARPDGSERRLLWEWGRQPDVRRGDGRVVLNGDGQGRDNLWTVNLDGGNARESSLHPEDAHPRWGPNGDRLVFDSQFYLWNDQRVWTIWVQNSVDKGSDPVSVPVADRVVPGEAPIWLDNDWIVYTGCNFWEGGSRCGLYTCPSWGDARAKQLTDQPDDRAGDAFG